MTSSMLAGEKRWANARKGGMKVLGKVAVPKPINLPSQKLENHGLDPNVEIVPKGSLSWGSRSSSSTSNPWGSSSVSPNADARPSSGGALSRPSTAGSDRHEPSFTAWGPNSRPSSASGVMTSSNQTSLTSSRPLSAETRPGSSNLSRFAEPAYDNNAWGPNVNADKLTITPKANDFSLSSGDFPTLGSEKDNTGKGSELHDHGSHVRPGSGSGRTAHAKMAQDHKSGTVDTWTRDGSPHFEDVGRPSDKWQHGDPQQYINPNIPPPPHFDAWRGPPPMNAPPPGGVWYRGPPPAAGPPYPPVPHGGYPMEPYPYYHPQIPPNIANPQHGPGPRGHHPRNGDFYRPQMPPEPFMRPNMPMRPGYYPGPVSYDGYYGPPMGYNPNDQFMGMPPGPPPAPHGPPVYNMGPHQNPSEFHDPHFRGNLRGPVGNIHVSEQLDSVPHEESRGPYKVLRKRDNERDVNMEGDNWEQNLEHNDQTRPSFHKNERENKSREGPHKSRALTESWGNKSTFPETSPEIPTNQKDPSLIQKIEDLNVDVRGDPQQKNRLLVRSNDNPTIAFGTICEAGDLNIPKSTTANVSSFSRQSHHVVRSQADYQNKGRLNNQDTDGTSESANSMVDPEEQRARMREIAKQRAIQIQQEEEERTKEQKAKARVLFEELDRRKLTTSSDGTTQTAESTATNVSEQEDVDTFTKPTGPITDHTKPEPPKPEPPISGLDTKAQVVDQIGEKSQPGLVDQPLYTNQSVVNTDEGSLHRQKRASHNRQKQSVQTVESAVDKSTIVGGTSEAQKVQAGVFIKDPSNNVTVSVESVPHQQDNPIILSESTQHKKKNNKISKNKHKPDDVTVSKDGDIAKKTAHSNNEEAHDRVPNQYKPQHSRRMPKNPQANRPVDKFHVGDVAVWAPVRGPNKEEHGDVDVPLSANNNINSGQNNNLKSKRAEMERYVPKPVAKELAQQEIVNSLDEPAICVSANVGPTLEFKGHDNKQNKPMKPYAKNNNNPVPTETKVVHEWDPSDGWCMPDEPPPVTYGVKDDGGKGKRPAYKGQKSTMKSNNIDYKNVSGSEFEMGQTGRPTSSKENRRQPKPHGYRGGQNEVKRVRPEQQVDEYNNNGRGAPHGGHEAIEQQHGSTGFRKFGGGQNNRNAGQDDRRKHNNQHNNANVNRERLGQNLHYEYQPVGSNNKPSTNPVAPTDGFGNAGSRYKERGSGSGSGHPRRGGAVFNGRQ